MMAQDTGRPRPAAPAALRARLDQGGTLQFIGIYDVFSASLAAQRYEALFVSGFGFAASHYGLPDIGFISWTDMVNFVQRLRRVLPTPHLLVDIDDGYCDIEVACHVIGLLEQAGASGVVLEDQRRPRRCGHFDGKQLLDLDEYLVKLRAVLDARRDLFVVARTDASDPQEIARRVAAFADTGADAILVDGLRSLDTLRELAAAVRQPFCFNQIAGGKSPPCTLGELRDAGVRIAIYSTPCLFAAQAAVTAALGDLAERDGSLAGSPVTIHDCNAVLAANHRRSTGR